MSKPLVILVFMADILLLAEPSDKFQHKCGPHEIFAQCPDAVCVPKTCGEVGYPVPCMDIGLDGKCPSEPGCICKEGYVRNCRGACIPMKKCSSCGGDNNAESGCGVNCGKHCSEYFGQRRPCPKICNVNGCDCREGFYYDEYAEKCVPPKYCTRPCPVNEKYGRYPDDLCTAQSCSELGFPINCQATAQDSSCSGEPGCICNDGYVRDDQGVCIPINNCPSCGGDENAESGCGFACGKHCTDLYNEEPKACILLCLLNGCQCKEGKYYDEIIKKCVDPSECSQVCRDNEMFSQCINGGCDRRNCTQLDKPTVCVHPLTCKNGCICDNGYLRRDDGTCVPENECPRLYCGRNEIYSSCLERGCEARTCKELGFPFGCAAVEPTTCTEGCLCIDGYLRDDDNICIPAKECPSCGGDTNAEAGCGVYCNRRCSDIGKEPRACTDICNGNTCDCKEGLYLDENTGKCVPPENCTTLVCGENEAYNSCLEGVCVATTCQQLGYPFACAAVVPTICTEGCLCKDGYLKDDDDKCVPAKNCPSCGGDTNAEAGCGVYCNTRCSDIGKEPRVCTDICNGNTCDCKAGFYLDENTGKCVLPENCPTLVCGENEVYNSCLEGSCEATTCQELGYPFACAAVIPTNCTEGCLCKDGYLRDDCGTCIPDKECPSCGGDSNAEAGCGVYCNTRCSDIGNEPRVCTERCNINTCDCKHGFYLDADIGKCVSPQYCTRSTTTTNESSVDIDTGLANLQKGNIAFTWELVYLQSKEQPGVSVVLSALSVLIAYAQLALYASGLVLEQLLRTLNLSNKEQIRKVFPVLLKNYQASTTATFEICVKTYANKYYQLNETFKQDAVKIFYSEAENIDFGKNVEAAKIINNWVANKTHGLIDKLVDSSMFGDGTRLVLVNGIYFLDIWQHQFNPKQTENRDFYLTPNTTKSIPTMYQKNTFGYYNSKELDAQVLQLRYKADNFSFVLWLPNQLDGLPALIEKLRNPKTDLSILSCARQKTVHVYLPTIRTKKRLNIKELSKQANITEMFKPRSNGFNGIWESNEPVYVSDVVQQAIILVTESGTEAAAATAVTVTTLSAAYPPPEKIVVEANHPFAYSVMFKNDPLFSGVFAGD